MSLFHPHLTQPPKGAEAFDHIREDFTPSQAAVLLSFAKQLRGGDAPLRARAAAQKRDLFLQPESVDDFPVPRLLEFEGPVPLVESISRVKKLHSFRPRAKALAAIGDSSYERAYRDCAHRVFDQPTAANAADLLALCLNHPKELIRIAAAITSLRLGTEPGIHLRTLAQGIKSQDALERDVAGTGLARYQPTHPALRSMSRRKRVRRVHKPPETLVLLHGTWADDAAWYRPGGDFHNYIGTHRTDLYAASDFPFWSGDYSDGARDIGAADLKRWVESRNEQGLDLMGHSHGANVILKATALGLSIGKAVLLSCPVHVDKYFPRFDKIANGVWSVRVKLDLVVLVDGGGQQFDHPNIQNVDLPIWFDHTATRDPACWQHYNVAQQIGL